MTRILGNAINSLVQVVDSNGDKVTDAVVNYKVYFYDYDDHEVWEIAESGLMTHIGDGLYQAEWTPEFAQDLNAYHSIDAENELTSMLSEYISMEIDLEILDMLILNALTALTA